MPKTPKHHFDVRVTRHDGGWIGVQVVDLPDVSIQVATMHDVESTARHAIGQWLEVNPVSVKVTILK